MGLSILWMNAIEERLNLKKKTTTTTTKKLNRLWCVFSSRFNFTLPFELSAYERHIEEYLRLRIDDPRKKNTIKKQQHCPIFNCSESPSLNRMQPNEKQTNMNLNTRHLNDDPTIADIVFRLHFAFTAEWLLLLLLLLFFYFIYSNMCNLLTLHQICIICVWLAWSFALFH